MQYVWKYFRDLNARRTGNGFGPMPLQYSEMLAYFQLYNISYEPIEIQLIELLDDVAMQYYTKEIQKEQAKNKPKK